METASERPIQKLVRLAGSVTAAARLLGMTRQSVHIFLRDPAPLRPVYELAIASLINQIEAKSQVKKPTTPIEMEK